MTTTQLWDPDALLDYLQRHADEIALGGVVASRAVRRTALSPDKALATLVDRGMATRLRRGWYAFEGADPTVSTAVRSGGVLTCVSALAFHQIWTPLSATSCVHARGAQPSTILRTPVRTCWVQYRLPSPRIAVDSPLLALRAATNCLSRDELVAAIDSALCLGVVREEEVELGLRCTPHRSVRNARRARRAESGTETLVRLRLRARHMPVQTQVDVPGVGRVDLLLGKRVVLEVDSRAHHTSVENYQKDRWRDVRLLALGYVVIRVTWEQVMFQWPEVEELILAAVRSHSWPRLEHAEAS